MSKERELLARVLESRTFMQGVALRREIEQLLAQPEQEPVYWENEKKALLNEIDDLTNRLAQPEQTKPVEICPNCGSKVTWYHLKAHVLVVCEDKCQGYKVIASRGRRDECFTKGDL